MKRLIAHLTARTRTRSVFHAVQSIQGMPVLKKLVKYYDPNWIRRRISVQLDPNYIEMRKDHWSLLVDVNDHIGYNSFMRNEPFEQTVYTLGKRLGLGRDDVILDIGANIGTASVPLSAEQGCELIAVEASKGNGFLLSRNIFINRLKCRLHMVALTSTPDAGYLPLYIRGGNTGANSLLEQWNPSVEDTEPEWVPTTTLDELVSDDALIDRIGFIKIDVEGAEGDVLKGGRAFLKKNRAPVLMEYRVEAVKKYLDRDMSDVLEIMCQDYDVHALDDDLQEIPFDPATSYENILFRRKAD